MDDAKRRLQLSFLGPLRSPEILKAYRKTLRGGLLLYGPPGCGKAFIARATAGELRSTFMPIALAVGASEAVALFDGGLHQLFDTARTERALRAVLRGRRRAQPGARPVEQRGGAWRDEAVPDRAGGRRRRRGRSVRPRLDEPTLGASTRRCVAPDGSTGRCWSCRPTNRRASRSSSTSSESDRPHDLDLGLIAARTDGFSSADLVQLCESAVERALEDSLESGETRAVRQEDLVAAFSALQPSTRPWFEIAKNYAAFANASGEYDDLLGYVRARGL